MLLYLLCSSCLLKSKDTFLFGLDYNTTLHVYKQSSIFIQAAGGFPASSEHHETP